MAHLRSDPEAGTNTAYVEDVRRKICQLHDQPTRVTTSLSGGRMSPCLRAKSLRGRRPTTRTPRARISSIRSNIRCDAPRREWDLHNPVPALWYLTFLHTAAQTTGAGWNG